MGLACLNNGQPAGASEQTGPTESLTWSAWQDRPKWRIQKGFFNTQMLRLHAEETAKSRHCTRVYCLCELDSKSLLMLYTYPHNLNQTSNRHY